MMSWLLPPGRLLIGMAVAAAMMLTASCASGSQEDTPNQLTDLRVCASVSGDSCQSHQGRLPVETETIHVTATVVRAVNGTEALATLTRVEGDQRSRILSYSVGIDADEETGTAPLAFFFDSSGAATSDGRWLPGEYEVKIEIHAAGLEPAITTIVLE